MSENGLQKWRVLIVAGISVFFILGLILIIRVVAQPEASQKTEAQDALASSTNSCVTCHRKSSPGIVDQYSKSSMAAAEVTCQNCHEVEKDYPGAVPHEGTFVLQSPSAAKCKTCHTQEVAQFNQSRHALPAYVAVHGSTDLNPQLMSMYQAIPEGSFAPDKSRNAIAALEGDKITKFACETCHDIGKPAVDQSIGQCQKCHLRHEFSLEQVRKPETCNQCHIGPDHPQWEIYQESPHGTAYQTTGDTWNWDAEPGTLTVKDFPAATCQVCHMSGFGGAGTTHDVGDRLTWYLFAPVSERRPAWQDNKVAMQTVCLECHNKNFVKEFYDSADLAVGRVNEWVKESDAIVAPLQAKGLLTKEPFDQPIDFTYFELWHHWGRTAKFGTWMQGADYVQWHGAYEILSDLAELHDLVDSTLKGAETNK